MGRSAGRVLLALLGAAGGFAQIQHQVSVINISVPVRVYDGAKFVNSLGLEDFEVSEDGKPQPVEDITSSYYVLGYTVPSVWDGAYHKIKVRALRPGLKVYSQNGYYNPKPSR